MQYHKLIKIPTLIVLLLFNTMILAQTTKASEKGDVKHFIEKMVHQYHFKQEKLQALFNKVQVNQHAIDLMNTPYEMKPWYLYRKHFIQENRIQQGVIFWRQHRHILATVAQRTGVPAEYIIAIIGVESRYGKTEGTFPAFDILYTFAFHYPRRADFFRNELKEYLLLCREQQWDPLSIHGSYAAALGQAQFMPSNYRIYAKSYDDAKHIDLFNSEADVIASIANYFYLHGWQRNQPVASQAIVIGQQYKQLPIQDRNSKISKLKMTLAQLQHFGVRPAQSHAADLKATFMRFDLKNKEIYWLGFHNFYVITRYNTSKLYALAIYQLATQIKQQYQRRYQKI